MLNEIYKRYEYSSDQLRHSPILHTLQQIARDSIEVIYFGESSNNTTHPEDLDKRSISELISNNYPKLKFGTIQKEATHANIFLKYLHAIPEPNKIKTVIFTFNLRSFNAGWIYSDLETSLQKSTVFLKAYPPLLNRFLLIFKDYPVWDKAFCTKKIREKWNENNLFPTNTNDSISNVFKWQRAVDIRFKHKVKTKENDSIINLSKHYIKNYAFNLLAETNPRVKDWDKIVEFCQTRKWNIVFNLMAENTEQAQILCDNPLIHLIYNNVEYLKNRYTKLGVTIVDNLNQLNDSYFIDRNWPTEHYREEGRKIIARNVIASLNSFHPSLNQITFDSASSIYSFYEDAEFKNDGKSDKTLSKEQSHTGSSSSKTNKDSEFSIGFNILSHKIPNLTSSALIEFYLYQEELDHNASLVFQIDGNQPNESYISYPIKDYTSRSNTWIKISQSYPLPAFINKSKVLKVYVWNNSDVNIYVDDLKLKFQ